MSLPFGYRKGDRVRIKNAGDEFDGQIAVIVEEGRVFPPGATVANSMDTFILRLENDGREGSFASFEFIPLSTLERLAECAE